MAGRGVVEKEDKQPHPRVVFLTKGNEWKPAVDPLHFDKPAAGVGLGKRFAEKIGEANPGIMVGLVPCAVGGSPIDAWKPGVFYAPTKSHPWDDAVKRVKIAAQAGEFKGILWHQGESDSTPMLAGKYEEKLHDLIARLRNELGEEVPFIVGQLGQFSDKPWDKEKTVVGKVLKDLPGKVKGTAFADSTGLKHKGDGVHFDSAGYRALGNRYANAFLKLTQKQKPSSR
ncbi:MAG: sialate O-acetylesterase [Gemmataceae bacterium]|nr:sialate O-acetylesterase [Gemmataceae bacterium]